jgi:hypothetical protein
VGDNLNLTFNKLEECTGVAKTYEHIQTAPINLYKAPGI